MARSKKLEGTLTRAQRVEVAKDVIALCRSRQRKIKIDTGAYFDTDYDKEASLLRERGQLTAKRLPPCTVCARGALFVASVDRYDRCELSPGDYLSSLVQDRSEDDWGSKQTKLIESAFEGWLGGDELLPRAPKERLIAIMENIVANNGEYRP